jgi:hypothetical protein
LLRIQNETARVVNGLIVTDGYHSAGFGIGVP